MCFRNPAVCFNKDSLLNPNKAVPAQLVEGSGEGFYIVGLAARWRGEPLRDYETVVKLIAKTTTAKGLKVICRLGRRKYQTGREVSNAQMEHLEHRLFSNGQRDVGAGQVGIVRSEDQ
jgi:Rhodopirellula transposase DDE domain